MQPRGGPRDRARARCCSRPAPSTGACLSRISPTTRGSASSTRPGRPRRSSAAPHGSAWSAAATRPARPPSGWPAAAPWSRCCTAAPTCARRCRTTWSRELERYGVAVRDRSEIAALHGDDGQLEAVTLKTGDRLPFSFLFLFLGALPCTDWLGDVVARDEKGFILTGAARRAPTRLLETSVAGDLRRRRRALRARPSAARRPSARGRWPCSSSTAISPERRAEAGPDTRRRAMPSPGSARARLPRALRPVGSGVRRLRRRLAHRPRRAARARRAAGHTLVAGDEHRILTALHGALGRRRPRQVRTRRT